MIRWVPFEALAQRHLVAIADSMLAAPLDVRLDIHTTLEGLKIGIIRAFEFGDRGFLLVSTTNKRLRLEAYSGSVWQIPQVAKALQRLATDWECDTLETMVYDTRLASAIEKIGGRVESITLTLAVEGDSNERR